MCEKLPESYDVPSLKNALAFSFYKSPPVIQDQHKDITVYFIKEEDLKASLSFPLFFLV